MTVQMNYLAIVEEITAYGHLYKKKRYLWNMYRRMNNESNLNGNLQFDDRSINQNLVDFIANRSFA